MQPKPNGSDNIILATRPNEKSQFVDGITNQLKGNYAKELDYLVKKNYKPINISDVEWIAIKNWFK